MHLRLQIQDDMSRMTQGKILLSGVDYGEQMQKGHGRLQERTAGYFLISRF